MRATGKAGSAAGVTGGLFAPTAVEREDEDALADAIERDGRALAAAGGVVTLGRYLSAVEGLAQRPVALDAAIDVVIRSGVAAGVGLDEVVGRVVTEFPELARAVRECVQLNALLPTTPGAVGVGSSGREDGGALVGEWLGPEEADGQPRYRVLAEVGSGSFGVVVRAVDRRLGDAESPAQVAIKVLTGAGAEGARVLDEAVKARRVDHPHIVRVIDCGRDERHGPYIVYELVEGGDLSRRLSEGRGALPAREAAWLVAAAARGIHAAHAAGLIHMDLKPANVLLTSEGVPKVADFGNALRWGGRAEAAAEGRNLRGNIAYLAPEQLRDPSAASTAVDIYALGGILLTALVGDVPLGYGLDPSVRGEVEGRLAGFPRDLRRIVARAMAPEAGDRHESAAALAEDLERWLSGRPIGWMRPSVARRVGLWARRRPGVASLVGLLAAAVVMGAWVGWHYYVQALTSRLETQALQRFQKQIRSFTGGFMEDMSAERTMELESSLMSQAMVTDWMFGPRMFGDVVLLMEAWDRRMKEAKGLLEELRGQGRADEFRTLVWQTTYGLWCVQDGSADEAYRELSDNRRRWAARLGEGDPWVGRIDDLVSCARCRLAWEGAVKPGVSAARDEELRARAAELRERAEAFLAAGGRGQVHQTMVLTLRDAYGPFGLGDRAGAAWAEGALKTYGGSGELRPMRVPPGEKKPGWKLWW